MSRTLQVMGADNTFRIEVPETAKVYIGPLVPPRELKIPDQAKITNFYYQRGDEYGRDKEIYALHVEDIDGSKLAMIPRVNGFRDLSVNYTERVATEEGATVWKSDQEGYKREESVRRTEAWQIDKSLPPPATKGKRK